MANITLGAIRDYLRAVADWATGQATVAPKVQLSGSVPSRVVRDNILNAVSLPPSSSTGEVSMGITDESEVWVQVAIDQQPWRLDGSSFGTSFASHTTAFFPRRIEENRTYGITNPATSLFLPLAPISTRGVDEPKTLMEARAFLTPPPRGAILRIHNQNETQTATVSVWIIRIWR